MWVRWLVVVAALGVAAVSCGGDDDESNGTGGAAGGGATGGAAGGGGTGGSAGSSSGGTGGINTDSGSGGAAGSNSGDAATCGDYGQGTDCQTCLLGHCCSQMQACKADANCDAMVVCARLCPTPTDTSSQCVKDCVTNALFADGGDGSGSYNQLILCMGSNCGTPCGYL